MRARRTQPRRTSAAQSAASLCRSIQRRAKELRPTLGQAEVPQHDPRDLPGCAGRTARWIEKACTHERPALTGWIAPDHLEHMQARARKSGLEGPLEDNIAGFELSDRMNRLGRLVDTPARLRSLRGWCDRRHAVWWWAHRAPAVSHAGRKPARARGCRSPRFAQKRARDETRQARVAARDSAPCSDLLIAAGASPPWL